MSVASWELQRKCNALDPVNADDIFFPGKEGKRGSRGAPSKAQSYCASCPVRGLCLMDAIENDLDGNWAGTSKTERRSMAGNYVTIQQVKTAETRVEAVLPPKRKITARVSEFLIIPKTLDPYEWLDRAVGPAPDDLSLA